ncbi:hypothetical protein MED217_15655 [Leeuwenhoekiella blandensis MED217]|uniref:Uncharacterized protein n=1 Tax=Leeuwenhoekiella blandensis (strain CECT 7118 / CCUG 51940 / KCTC 22103 / MED217) TaxID=398720 RepID=A3XIA3_LEEBM|nr:hypothetical protein MED217_15655 [Leeuwenhoekiella blandensis MED217]
MKYTSRLQCETLKITKRNDLGKRNKPHFPPFRKKLLPKFRDGKSGSFKNLEPNPDPETSGGLGSLDSSAL